MRIRSDSCAAAKTFLDVLMELSASRGVRIVRVRRRRREVTVVSASGIADKVIVTLRVGRDASYSVVEGTSRTPLEASTPKMAADNVQMILTTWQDYADGLKMNKSLNDLSEYLRLLRDM